MTQEFFTQLYTSNYTRLFHSSRGVVVDGELAKEIVNDAFMKLLSREGAELLMPQAQAWLHRAVVNASIDHLRKAKRDALAMGEFAADEKLDKNEDIWAALLDEPSGEKQNLVEKIRGSLDKLSDGYRVVLTLHLFEGYDFDEIAQIMGVKAVSVRTQYIRGKAKLLEILQNG